MQPKFSEDVVPVTVLKINSASVIRHTAKAHRPVLLTSRGKGIAVLQSLEDYERIQEENEFIKAVLQGEAELKAGKGLSASEVKRRLKLG